MNRTQRALVRMRHAQTIIASRLSAFSSGSRIASGLAHEGYDAGYAQCLRDLDLLLRGIEPNDDRGFWRSKEDERTTQ
jgi:hypothetical protein